MGDYYGSNSNKNNNNKNNNSNNNNSNSNSSHGRPTNNHNNANSGGADTGKIFVGGLSWQTTEESLRWHFEQYGTVLSTEIMRDRNTGDPRGFGFVVFADISTVDLVMKEDRHEVNHKIVDVKRAQARGIAPPSIHQQSKTNNQNNNQNNNNQNNPNNNSNNGHQPSAASGGGGGGGGGSSSGGGGGNNVGEMTPEQAQTKVFVGGIPPHIDRDELREIFQRFGPVTDTVVMMDQATQRSRCFGFVTFEHGSDGATKAVEAQPIQVHGRRVEVKLATPRVEQQGGRRPIAAAAVAAAGPRNLGLRAGKASSTSTGEFAGLAVAYGRNGWKAGYGSKAFGQAGWAVQGWDNGGADFERSGFSFATTDKNNNTSDGEEPAAKRAKI